MYESILCPVDGSVPAQAGAAEAARLAAALGARLELLHVLDLNSLIVNSAGMAPTGEAVDALRDDGRRVIEAARGVVAAMLPQVEAQLVEGRGGTAADAIVERATEGGAQLIVMGTHGRRGLSHALLGSTAEAVVRSSPVPVLLVRGG